MMGSGKDGNILFFSIGAGLGSLFKAFPLAHEILKWGSLAYLMYLAWKIATSTGIGPADKNGEDAKPISFFGSVAFQWINVKAWVAAITLVTAFTDPDAYWTSLAAGGTLLKRFLEHPVRLRVFNLTMAALLVISVVPSVLRA